MDLPTKSTRSKETLDKMKICQQYFSNPHRLITNRGTAYTGNDLKQCPIDVSQVESIHRIILAVLTNLCIENPTLWYRHVSVQRSLNSTYQRSIHTSPFKLLIGTELTAKDDFEIIELLQEEELILNV